MQDFAQGKTGWMGETLQPTLAPHYRGVGAAGRGRQCSLRCRVSRGGLRVGKRRPEVVLMGGAASPFSFVPGKFVSSALLGRGKWLSSLLLPPPQSPRAPSWHYRAPGAGAPARSRAAVCRSPSVSGEKFGGVAAVAECAGREVVPGDVGRWAGGPAGGWRAALPGGSDAVGEGMAGSLCPEARLRVTLGLSIWGRGVLNPGALLK